MYRYVAAVTMVVSNPIRIDPRNYGDTASANVLIYTD